MQYYIWALSSTDQNCAYAPFTVSKKLNLMSSDEELAELFYTFEYSICVFSLFFTKQKKFTSELQDRFKTTKILRYRPNKKAQHLFDLTNEFYNSKASKKFLLRKAFFIAPGLKKLFRVLTQNSNFHKPEAGTPLLLRKTRILESTPYNNRIRYLFHRVHSVNILQYSKLRLDLFSRTPILASSPDKGIYNRSVKQPVINAGVYITLPFDNSLSLHKSYHPWMSLVPRKKR